MARHVTDHAIEVVPAADYRTPAWYEARRSTVSASEIAAVLGISPWSSPFDLWWAKRTGDNGDTETEAMRMGRRLEPLILEDFSDAHPELTLTRAGLCTSLDRPWQACTPDALAHDRERHEVTVMQSADPVRTIDAAGDPVAVVEAKTAGSADGWGEDGSDDIPVHYRAQVLWQMDTLALNVAYVAVWLGFAYREYVVEYHEADVAMMRDAALAFLRSIEDGTPPDIDSHAATRRRLRKLHPSVVDGEVEVRDTIVRQYHAAKRLRDTAQDRMNLAENRLRAQLGDYRVAVVDGQPVATRSVSDIPERTQTIAAHTRNTVRFRKPKEARA